MSRTLQRPFHSICDAVGRTPIVSLHRIAGGLPNRLFGKCEFMNPGGSVKDRIALRMIETAERAGLLAPGGTVIEATAGNTGMGLAMVAALRGYRMIVVMTTKMSREKVNVMRAAGVEVVICPYEVTPDHPDHFINRARTLAREIAGAWFADQFANRDNLLAHRDSTGPEIWEQMAGEIDVLVAGIGTGGTLCGTGAYLKSRNPDIRLVAADPVGSILGAALRGEPRRPAGYLIEGIGGDFVPTLADLALVDDVVPVSDADAIATALTLFRREGIFVGGSAGCILAAALRICAATGPRGPRNVLAILPDGGRSYLSTIYDPEWRALKGIHLGAQLEGGQPCT